MTSVCASFWPPRTNPYLDGIKVGLIIPSVNTVVEPEFMWLAPPGISFHTARVMLKDNGIAALQAMNLELREAAHKLASTSPDLVAYACTAGSFVDGKSATRPLAAMIKTITQCPVVTTSDALVQALQALNVTRVALGAPYPDAVTQAEKAFLVDSGFDVVSCLGLGRTMAQVRATTFEDIFHLASSVDRAEAQAIFLSCTDIRALEMIEYLETRFSKPVLTSNQITLWAILRQFDKHSLPEFPGSLFTLGM